MIISAGITAVSGVVVWMIKDKQKSDLDYFKDLVKALKEDVKETQAANKELTEMLKAEQADKKTEAKKKDECLETVHQMEIAAQKKDNEITALKIVKNNNTNNY